MNIDQETLRTMTKMAFCVALHKRDTELKPTIDQVTCSDEVIQFNCRAQLKKGGRVFEASGEFFSQDEGGSVWLSSTTDQGWGTTMCTQIRSNWKFRNRSELEQTYRAINA